MVAVRLVALHFHIHLQAMELALLALFKTAQLVIKQILLNV